MDSGRDFVKRGNTQGSNGSYPLNGPSKNGYSNPPNPQNSMDYNQNMEEGTGVAIPVNSLVQNGAGMTQSNNRVPPNQVD